MSRFRRCRIYCGSTASAGRYAGLQQLVKGLNMPIGTVKWFNANKGFGFIEPEDGSKDAFVHISAVERAGLSGLQEGQKIEYELEEDQRGRVSAANLQVVQ
jgi:CspA family cold shock protein